MFKPVLWTNKTALIINVFALITDRVLNSATDLKKIQKNSDYRDKNVQKTKKK